jgi:HSP90 family molecular chaperone
MDNQQIIETVNKLFISVDKRDWDHVKSIFIDKVILDYTSMTGGELPDHFNLVVNSNNPIVGKLLLETKEEKQGSTIKQLFDLALLAQGLLKGKKLGEFIRRSTELVK